MCLVIRVIDSLKILYGYKTGKIHSVTEHNRECRPVCVNQVRIPRSTLSWWMEQELDCDIICVLHFGVHVMKILDSVKVTYPFRRHSCLESDKNMDLINFKNWNYVFFF